MSAADCRAANCNNPIEAAVLADYWLGVLPEAEEAPLEEHLLACDECGARLREVMALAECVRHLLQEGRLRMVVSDAFLRRAAEECLCVRHYAPPRGWRVQLHRDRRRRYPDRTDAR